MGATTNIAAENPLSGSLLAEHAANANTEEKKKLFKMEVSESDIEKLQHAVFLEQIAGLNYRVGEKITITIDREEDGLRKARGVVLGNYPRWVLVGIINKAGRNEKFCILKSDILRESTGVKGQTRGGLKIGLYQGS
jgi:hypothetical protein